MGTRNFAWFWGIWYPAITGWVPSWKEWLLGAKQPSAPQGGGNWREEIWARNAVWNLGMSSRNLLWNKLRRAWLLVASAWVCSRRKLESPNVPPASHSLPRCRVCHAGTQTTLQKRAFCFRKWKKNNLWIHEIHVGYTILIWSKA